MKLTDVQLNQLAQYLYEEISDSPDMELRMLMTNKTALVDCLDRSLERVK